MTYSAKMLENVVGALEIMGPLGNGVRSFLESLMMPDGGFRGRGQNSDLYYGAFAMDCMAAFGDDNASDNIEKYLAGFGVGTGLDLVHLACLAKCWSRVKGGGLSKTLLNGIVDNVEACRCDDGGYSREKSSASGSVYGCFFAESAYQDLGVEIPDPAGVVRSIRALKISDGSFRAERGLELVTTNAVAGAILLIKKLDGSIEDAAVSWLLKQCHEYGGFLAAASAPVPDLVSTATALFALQEADASLDEISDGCTDFVEGLWSDNDGGFAGHCLDDTIDCEYTFYGLLSLGILCK